MLPKPRTGGMAGSNKKGIPSCRAAGAGIPKVLVWVVLVVLRLSEYPLPGADRPTTGIVRQVAVHPAQSAVAFCLDICPDEAVGIGCRTPAFNG